MKKIQFALLSIFCLLGSFWSISAQSTTKPSEVALETNSQTKKSLTPEEIIRQFTTRESELRETFKEYSYIQESKLQVIGPADTVSGEFYQVSEFVFNDAGKRIERILKAPQPTLDRTGLTMTQEDKNAFINLQPFALSAEDLPNYTVTYVGKEKVDQLDTYVFDVNPKVMTDKKELNKLKRQKIEGKFFQGRIWVDDQDLQIVKSAGKVVPEFDQRFPKFETYRENIDGRYWFPTYTYGDDNLEFDNSRFHVRMVTRYKNYRQFQSDVKLTGEAEEVTPDEQAKPGEVKKAEPGKKPPNQ
jgi:outer membrane lipoprotein-sorting protein